jgi:hypothetical protein
MLGRRDDHAGSAGRNDLTEDPLLAEQISHGPRGTIEGVVSGSGQLLHLPAVPLPGGCDSDAVPEDAGQLSCLQARMPGADDQDVLRTAVSEVAPEIEGFLKRDPAREAAHGGQRVLCGRDVLLDQELQGLDTEILAVGSARDRVVMQRMGEPDNGAPAGKVGQDAVQVGRWLYPGDDVGVLEQLRPGGSDGRSRPDVHLVLVPRA